MEFPPHSFSSALWVRTLQVCPLLMQENCPGFSCLSPQHRMLSVHRRVPTASLRAARESRIARCGSDVSPGVFHYCTFSCLSSNDTKLNHLFPVTHFPQKTEPSHCQPVYIRNVGTRPALRAPAQGLSQLWLPVSK